MDKIFSTSDLHPRERLRKLENTLSEAILPQRVRKRRGQHFHAEIRRGSVGALQILLVNCSQLQIDIGPKKGEARPYDEVAFCLQLGGELLLRHAGRESLIRASDMVLIDPCCSGEATIETTSNTVVLKIPRQELSARIGSIVSFAGVKVTRDSAEGRLTSAVFDHVITNAHHFRPTMAGLVQGQILDLVALTLTTCASADDLSTTRAAWLLKLRTEVEARLSDPELDRVSAASLAGCSVRYANTLLAEQNLSLTKLIWQRRLARCKMALDDDSDRRAIREIASSWGFKDMTHFARRFREAYGVSPAEYRKCMR